MRFVVAFAIALFIAFACAPMLKKVPIVAYALCILADMLYAFGMAQGSATGFLGFYIPFMQRCTLAMAFFTIVMFIGVFDEESGIRRRLLPIRRQLSICGCLLCLGHICYYAYTYAMQLANGAQVYTANAANNLAISLAISTILVVLLLALGATSFTFVKARMKAATWKKVQRLSYLFFTLIVVHLAIILVPPALSGNTPAIESVAVWGCLFAVYAVTKTRHEIKKKRLLALGAQ